MDIHFATAELARQRRDALLAQATRRRLRRTARENGRSADRVCGTEDAPRTVPVVHPLDLEPGPTPAVAVTG